MDLQSTRKNVPQTVELFRDADEMIVNIPKVYRMIGANKGKVMAGELIENFSLGSDGPPDMNERALQREQPVHVLDIGLLQEFVLQEIDLIIQLIQKREIAVHD